MPSIMAASRSNPLLNSLPRFLTWRSLGFRTICSGRLGFAPSDPDPEPPVSTAGTKFLETFREEFEIGSRLITFETGKIARFANGSVVLGMEETKVDYQEKQFAQGVIPSTYLRREGAPKERELLCGRLIDRPIRPLFPAGFYHEVQLMQRSAALMLSDIPWGGPIGVIRIGRICGQFVVNPTMDELSLSDLNLVYACTKDKTLMIDVQAGGISEKDLEAGLRLAHPEAVKYLEPQIRLAAKAGKHKKDYKLSLVSDRTLEKVRNLTEAKIEAVFTDPSYGKDEQWTGTNEPFFLTSVTDNFIKVYRAGLHVVRNRILAEGFRVDGRHLDEVRPLYCEAGTLAEKALLAVLPPEDDFPLYSSHQFRSNGIRWFNFNGDCLWRQYGHDGCWHSIQEHVAGVSVGLVSEVDPSTEPALKGRLQILARMDQEISAPRTQDHRNSPRLATLKFSNDALRRLIGPLGVLKRKIEEDTGARMSVCDETLTILAKNQTVLERVQEKEYGAFVEFNGGQARSPRFQMSISVGQQLSLMCIGQDVRGNIKLSLKATLPQLKSKKNNVTEEPVPVIKEAPKVWTSVGNLPNEQEEQKLTDAELMLSRSTVKPSTSSNPGFLIRSAAEW
ncbi:polyribonucleotide nucleotidyltransferase 2 [Populus alba x Populus x berolinensis]|nr:polyribonucleotide nucleotidyltransferase 2 [Populus alba x Populus x berolinensis]